VAKTDTLRSVTTRARLREIIGVETGDPESLASHRSTLAAHRQVLVAEACARFEAVESPLEAPARARLVETVSAWLETGFGGPEAAFVEASREVASALLRAEIEPESAVAGLAALRARTAELLRRCESWGPRVDATLDRVLQFGIAVVVRCYGEVATLRVERQERLARLGQLVGAVAHDLRNPLGTIQSSLYLLDRGESEDTDAALRKHLARIGSQVRVSEAIIERVLGLARAQEIRRESVDVAALFQDAQAGLDLRGQEVAIEVPPGLHVHADPTLLRQALVNLLGNACGALGERSGVIVMVAATRSHGLTLTVSDDGPGFAIDFLARAFEPLETNRATGLGLGLALVQRIVEAHGGTVVARNRTPRGAEVELCLPAG